MMNAVARKKATMRVTELYSATTTGHLTTHKRTHSGERPHACNEPGCEYRAAEAGHHTKHKRTNSGERPAGARSCQPAVSAACRGRTKPPTGQFGGRLVRTLPPTGRLGSLPRAHAATNRPIRRPARAHAAANWPPRQPAAGTRSRQQADSIAPAGARSRQQADSAASRERTQPPTGRLGSQPRAHAARPTPQADSRLSGARSCHAVW
ncbi:hypothetical protein T492DRAFT_850677 [Pavlovales sp. CCMP2436]|nr:hypothetical protein T492DRAFT_850677 [Pavlovales sp. CCMP2436]